MSYVGSRGGGYKVSGDLQRSPESYLRRSQEISRDLQRSPSPEISGDLHLQRSPESYLEISGDLQWGEYIKDVLCQRGLQRGEYIKDVLCNIVSVALQRLL